VYKVAFAENDVNGCGSKGGIDFPDSLWGASIFAACGTHDVDWREAKTLEDLKRGNKRFRENMELIVDAESSNRFIQWMRLKTMSRYYRMVKLVGTPAEAKARGFR